MTRKLAGAAAALAALTFAGTALAGDGADQNRLTLTGSTVQRNLVDTGEPGFTLGDQIELSDHLSAGVKPAWAYGLS